MTKSDIVKKYLLNNNEHFSTSDNQAYYIANTKKQFENNQNPFGLKGNHITYTDSQIKSLKSKSMIWEQYRQKYIECVEDSISPAYTTLDQIENDYEL